MPGGKCETSSRNNHNNKASINRDSTSSLHSMALQTVAEQRRVVSCFGCKAFQIIHTNYYENIDYRTERKKISFTYQKLIQLDLQFTPVSLCWHYSTLPNVLQGPQFLQATQHSYTPQGHNEVMVHEK